MPAIKTSPSPLLKRRAGSRDYWEAGTFKYGCLHDRLLCILGLLRRTRPATLLDVGCSTGELYRAVHEHLPRTAYFGCDISQAAVDRLASRQVVQCDLNADELPFAGQVFDCVVASGICEYLDDLPQALDRFRRRLGDEGVLLISYVNAQHLARRVRRLLGRSPGGNRTWRPLASLGRFECLLHEARFTVTERVITNGRIEAWGRAPETFRPGAYRTLLGRCRPLSRLLARQVIFVCQKGR